MNKVATKHIVTTVTVKEVQDQLDMLERLHDFSKDEIVTSIEKTQKEYSGELWSAFIDQVIWQLLEEKNEKP